MSDRRRVDELDEGLSQPERQELPGLVPRPDLVESMHRSAVAARRRVPMWLRRDLFGWYMQSRQFPRHCQGVYKTHYS